MTIAAQASGRGLRDRALIAWLALVLVLQLVTWSRQEGYSEADAVEFVSRAQAWVERVDLGQERLTPRMRPFGFSALFVPLFAVARMLDLDDLRPVLAAARCLQIALALTLLVVTARLAAELGGRRAGLAAAFLLGVNPLFLHYSVTPVSGIAAALCVALGLRRALAGAGFRAGLASGLWLAAGVLVAYQSLMVALILGALLCVRHRWSGRATWAGYLAGCCVCLPAGALVDRIAYGAWGVSLLPYLASNFGFIAVRFLVDLGLRDLATQLYTVLARLTGGEFDPGGAGEPVGQLQGRAWYLTTLPNVLVWPAAAFGVLGLAALTLRVHRRAGWLLAVLAAAASGFAPARPLLVVPAVALALVWAWGLAVRAAPDWKAALLGLLLALVLLVMSTKGNKLYRLWLPVLPVAVVLCAWGFELLAGRSRARLVLALCVLLFAWPLGHAALERLPLKRYSSYWHAVDWINDAVATKGPIVGRDEPRLAAAFAWAIYLRASDAIGTAQLPAMIDVWDQLAAEEQAELTNALDGLDWLVLHEPVVRMHPGLMAVVNERMHVRAAFFEPEQQSELGPVYVLSRREAAQDGEDGARSFSFFELSHGPALPVRAPLATTRTPVYFRNREVAGQPFEGVTLLAIEHETLPGDGFGWLTWHWRADSEFRRDYRVLSRITGPGSVHLWRNNHDPASGVWPTSTWQPGWILKESFLLVPRVEAQAALAASGPGDASLPGDVWVSLNVQPDKRRTTHRLEVFRPGEQVPVAAQLAREVYESEDGFVFAKDGMTRVGRVALSRRE
jgi:hypothetical protein